MKHRYFFDKRVVKKNLIKYGLIFLFLTPILVVANNYLNKSLKFWSVIIIDIVIALFAILIVNLIIKAIKNSKENDIVAQKVEIIKSKRKDNNSKKEE